MQQHPDSVARDRVLLLLEKAHRTLRHGARSRRAAWTAAIIGGSVGLCLDYCRVLASFRSEEGIPFRIVMLRSALQHDAHAVVEVRVGDHWMLLDPTFSFVADDLRVAELLGDPARAQTVTTSSGPADRATWGWRYYESGFLGSVDQVRISNDAEARATTTASAETAGRVLAAGDLSVDRHRGRPVKIITPESSFAGLMRAAALCRRNLTVVDAGLGMRFGARLFWVCARVIRWPATDVFRVAGADHRTR